jgi:aldose 1-epimerase
MNASLKSRNFGHLSTGETVEAWTLSGASGLVVEIITFGGIVTKVIAPDRDGKMADVVLGFDNLDRYVAGHPHFGAITGRVAGRTTGASFTLDGTTYKLVCNDPPNHLHGGLKGFDKRIWAATPAERPDGAPSVRLTYHSPEGEEGYPGNVDVAVTYTVTADNTFLIETDASTDRATPLNLTNHSYFNLAGEGAGPMTDQVIQIFADQYVPTDTHMTLLGRLESVAGKGNDFRQPRVLGEAIPKIFQSHGDVYLLHHKAEPGQQPDLAPAGRVVHPASGRVLEVSTTEKYVQFYTSWYLDGSIIGKSGVAYQQFAAFCLECHNYSDGANVPSMGDIILRPGHPQHHCTAYAFSTIAR